MDWWQWLLLAVAVLALATWAHLNFWVKRLTRPVRYDEEHHLRTPDGSTVELRRLKPPGGHEVAGSMLPPVLLVHGIAMNHRNLDADERLSLARQLRNDGRDVWLLTMRCGRAKLRRGEVKRHTFAALAEHDIPLAVAEVLERTGQNCLDYVGFSMGGILLYATLGRSLAAELVRRVVIIGSPGRIGRVVHGVGWLRRLPEWCFRWRLPLRPLSRLTAFASEWLVTPVHTNTMQLSNCQPGYVRHAAVDAVQSVPGPLLREFLHWSYGDGVIRLTDDRDILDGLRDATQPVLLVAGTRDRLAPPKTLEVVLKAWGANRKTTAKRLLVVGRSAGHPDDYGHADLAIGSRAPQEVHQAIREFLNGEG